MLREAVFNICQNEIEGARFLDLFAGSGAMSFEALSRGALQATLVEQNALAHEAGGARKQHFHGYLDCGAGRIDSAER